MKKHLSHSQVSMYQTCGLSYEKRYILGIKAPPGVSLLVGKGTHKSVEANLDAMIATGGEALPLEAARAIAADSTKEAWESDEPSPASFEGNPANAKGEAIDKAVSLASLHHTSVAPHLKPAETEEPFRIESDAWDFDIIGYKDVRETDGTIRDTKTTGKSPSSDAAAISDQLALYAWDAQLAGNPAPSVALDYLVATKTPKVVTLTANPDAEDFERVAKRFERAWAGIQAGVFMPAPRDSWKCCAKWCGYYDKCDHGAKHKTIVPVSRLVRHSDGVAADQEPGIEYL